MGLDGPEELAAGDGVAGCAGDVKLDSLSLLCLRLSTAYEAVDVGGSGE